MNGTQPDSPAGPALRGIIFDVEGVIAHPDLSALSAGLLALDPRLSVERLSEIRHAPDLYPLWQAFSTGDVDSDTYWAAVLRKAGLNGAEHEVAAMRALQSRATWARLDEAVLGLVDALRDGGLRVAVLSNSAIDYEPQISRFAHRFDSTHFSHRTGRRKPDPQAYLQLTAELGLDPSSVLFIDDKPRNIEAARDLGLRVCLFRSADQLHATLVQREALPA